MTFIEVNGRSGEKYLVNICEIRYVATSIGNKDGARIELTGGTRIEASESYPELVARLRAYLELVKIQKYRDYFK